MRLPRHFAPWLTIGAVLVVTTIALRLEGRLWWCACGHPWIWVTDVWSQHCSQHLLDPYSLSHVCHGLFFAAVLALAFKSRMAVQWQLAIAIAAAAAWEVLENSAWVINRYRTETMSLTYLGDSVANSLGDILCCGLGFAVARRLGWAWSIGLFIGLELVSLAWIRDNLTLNVIMLLHPIHAIKDWQTAGHMPA